MSTITIDKDIARFKSLFERYEQQLNGQKQHPIHRFRSQAADKLDELRFPTRRDEDYKYTSFSRLLKPEYQLAQLQVVSADKLAAFRLPDMEAVTVVTVNGILDEQNSELDKLPEGLRIMTVEQALEDKSVGYFVENILQRQSSQDNPFEVLNTTLADKGLFIHAAKNQVVETPIHLIQYNTQMDAPYTCNPLRIVLAEQGSQLSIVDSHYGEKDATYFSNVVNFFEVERNAHVYHYKFQSESETAFQVNNTTAIQDQDSTYTNLAVDLGGRIVRNNLSAIHRGENITSNFYGACLGTGDQHIDNQTFIDHAIPHCQSNELYKTILDEKARGVFNGKVMVRKDAQKTNAYQQNASLVLSEKAVMDSKPQLEIFADDVRCSHGATIGQLDQTSMFYLMSRGMPKALARQTLQNAFLMDVLELVPNESVRAAAEQLIQQKFDR